MMALEMKRRRRDDAVGVVQGSAAPCLLERHLGVLVEVARGFYVGRPRSVRADGRAERLRLGSWRGRPFSTARDDGGAPEGTGAEKPATRPLHERYCDILHT